MKSRTIHVCTSCGSSSMRWQGQCPGCGEWNTLESRSISQDRKITTDTPSCRPSRLSQVDLSRADYISTGMQELDEVLGGGLVPGGVVLLGGEPGIGKSTLLLQLLCFAGSRKGHALYVSGEESLPQIRSRAQRLGLDQENIQALATGSLEDILAAMDENVPYEIMIIDSVQTISSRESESIAGAPTQVRLVSSSLVKAAKKAGTCIFLVGHVTKEGQIAGPKLLEHMVDTVIYLEGDKEHLFRILRVIKNRYGPTDELVMFQMGALGLEVIQDPSTFFLQARDPALSGTAVVMAVDGHKPFAVEVQALATPSFLSIPRRTALGFDLNRLHLLLAVMEKKLQRSLAQSDIYTKIGGGLKLVDPGLDLGLVAAVLSSFHNQSLPERAVFWGEVDLNGQIRPVLGQDIRLKQALRLGYKPVFCPRSPDSDTGISTIMELQELLFGSNNPGS